MVPPQIANLGGSTKLHSNGGATDGCTYFCWGTNTGADHLTLKPKTDRYVVPEEGKFLIFPSWLMHGVPPNPKPKIRKALGINAMTKGKLGDRETISELDYKRYV